MLIVASGAVALVYQCLWMRQLSLVLGSTTYAVGTVLAAFMAGLGSGAWVLGNRVDRSPEPLRLYASLELAIGVLGLASPFVLAHGGAPYALCYARLHASQGLLTVARFALGFGFVAGPAFLMGGTLPVATRYVVRRADQLGRGIGQLYALNTLGAAAGVLLLPFVLLPTLGVRRTLFAAGFTNVAISLAAWLGARRESRNGAAAQQESGIASPPARRGVLAAFFLSGFVALALEVVWNRFFVIYIGSSIYGYAVILFLYLTGVVIGGMLFTVLDSDGRDPVGVFLACLLLLIADLAATVPLMDRIVYVQLAVLEALGVSFPAFQLANLTAISLVILPPTILLGVSFPAVAKAASPAVERIGSSLGFAYLVNTAGTTMGALAASFLLLPRLGLRASLDVLVAVAALALAFAGGRAARTRRGVAVAVSAAGLTIVPAITPGWDARLMHTGISSQTEWVTQVWRDGRLARRLDEMTVRELRDGLDATVSIVDYGAGHRVLFVNGKPDGGDGDDMPTQAILGHLPLLVHPAPRRVLVIGMGTGVSVASAAHYPVESIDLLEISPEVLELGGRWFERINRDVVHDPRLTVHLEDGRNFVAFDTGEPYDVIINEPSNPWMTGVASLFTDEFFSQLRRRLRPDGVLAQWFHYYNMDVGDVRALLGTLHRHFAHLSVFALFPLSMRGDMVMLASNGPLDFTAALKAMLGDEPTGKELRALGLGPTELLQSLVLSDDNVGGFVGAAGLNSDDLPVIELHAPRALFHDTTSLDFEAMYRASEGARVPLAGGEDFAEGFSVGAPPGFHRTSRAFRIELLPPPTPDAAPPRNLLTEVQFEDAAGRRLVVLSQRGRLGREELDRLAREATGGTVGADGAVVVEGHPAVNYGPTADGSLAVAWICPESGASYAAALSAPATVDGRLPADTLQAVRCHRRP